MDQLYIWVHHSLHHLHKHNRSHHNQLHQQQRPMIRQWLFLKNFHKTWSNETMDRFLVFILFLFFSSFALLPSQFSFLFSLFSHNFSWLNRENSYGGFVYCSANEDLSFSYVPSPSCLCDSSCLLIILFDTFPFSLRLECHFQEEEKDTDDVRAWPCVCVTVCMIEFLFSSRLFCLLLSLSLSFFPFFVSSSFAF